MDGCGDASCRPPVTEYPAPPPKGIGDAGVNCCQMPSMTCRVSVALPTQPTFAVDPNSPVEIEWPPPPVTPQQKEVDTGPRPDLLAMIPDQIVPQVVTMTAKPNFVNPAVELDALPHELCPDSCLHTRINPPPPKKKIEYRLPPQEEPIRGPPCRTWTQCVENALANDQVRRPLARCCYRRPLPPLVIPTTKLMQMHLKSTELQRKEEALQAAARERECKRLQARQRQSKWNYTVESLLDRKRAKEKAREEGETQDTRDLIAQVGREKKAHSDAQLARAKQLMLYRKGLIRDFHSALGYSKMMQEIEDMKSESSGCGIEDQKPQWMQKCTQKMMYPNTSRPTYVEDHEQKKLEKKKNQPVNQKLLERLRRVEQRQKEQKCEMEAELRNMQQMIQENLPELPEKYKNYLKDSVCDDDKKEKEHEKRACELYQSIGDKLAADAYIESAEKEIDRQAVEFMEYKRHVDGIRKQKEKQLIDDKVAYNIRKSEAAAAVLVKMQAVKKKRANEYDRLKDEWESEYEDKISKLQKEKDRKMQKVIADYNRRQCEAGWKRCELDTARQWARERLICDETCEKECEVHTERRKAAEDIALFNKALASAKQCREEKKRYLDNVWAAKMRNDYLEEMQEMKTYAKDCIEDWRSKGRSTLPMHQAMKKWEIDAGMQERKSARQASCSYESTSNRLGFFY